MQTILLLLTLLINNHANGKFVDYAPLLNQINSYRVENGLPKLIIRQKYQRATDKFAKTLPIHFRHDPNAKCFENIVYTTDYNEMFQLWKESAGHNKNMLRKEIVYANVSVYKVNKDGLDYYFGVFRGYRSERKTR